MNSRKRPQDAKDAFSVKFEPVVNRQEDVEITKVFAFPALHVYLGVVNKLCEVLEKAWPDFHQWPESLNLVRESYHGKCYEVHSFSDFIYRILPNLEILHERKRLLRRLMS